MFNTEEPISFPNEDHYTLISFFFNSPDMKLSWIKMEIMQRDFFYKGFIGYNVKIPTLLKTVSCF